jgi:ATP phosphoribosyltransferase regulatory subunit
LKPDAAGAALAEVWTLAGIQPVGGRSPAEIAQRLIQQAEGRSAPALTQGQAEAITAFLAVEGRPNAALDAIQALAPQSATELQAALNVWRDQVERLSAAGAPVGTATFSTALGHAFDYYDGVTFEVRSAVLGHHNPVAVGGRYDGLLGRLGGEGEGRAIGCMVRPGRALVQVMS